MNISWHYDMHTRGSPREEPILELFEISGATRQWPNYLPKMRDFHEWFRWSRGFEFFLDREGYEDYLPGGRQEKHPETWQPPLAREQVESETERWESTQLWLCRSVKDKLPLSRDYDEFLQLDTLADIWCFSEQEYRRDLQYHYTQVMREHDALTYESCGRNLNELIKRLAVIYDELAYMGPCCALPEAYKIHKLFRCVDTVLPGCSVRFMDDHNYTLMKADGNGDCKTSPMTSYQYAIYFVRQSYRKDGRLAEERCRARRAEEYRY